MRLVKALSLLLFTVVFTVVFTSCDASGSSDPGQSDNTVWIEVTNLSQIPGTWRNTVNGSDPDSGLTVSIVTTMVVSGSSATMTIVQDADSLITIYRMILEAFGQSMTDEQIIEAIVEEGEYEYDDSSDTFVQEMQFTQEQVAAMTEDGILGYLSEDGEYLKIIETEYEDEEYNPETGEWDPVGDPIITEVIYTKIS